MICPYCHSLMVAVRAQYDAALGGRVSYVCNSRTPNNGQRCGTSLQAPSPEKQP